MRLQDLIPLIITLILLLPPLYIHPAYTQLIPEDAIELKTKGDQARDIDEALDFYKQALQIYPDFPEVVYSLGTIYDKDLNDPHNAIYYYRRYLELEPQGPRSSQILYLIKAAEKLIEDRKRDLGLLGVEPIMPKRRRRPVPGIETEIEEKPEIEKKTPKKSETESIHIPQQTGVYTPPAPSPPQVTLSETRENVGDFLKIDIHEKVHKYSLKLAVWEREGFVDKFNELARMRGTPLEYDIAGAREALRIERKRVTEFINYTDEAIRLFSKKAVLKGMAYLGIDLDHFPTGWKPSSFIISNRIIENNEDDKFIDLTLEITLNLTQLYNELITKGYIFQPNRITLILQGVQGDIAEILIANIVKHSNFMGPSEGGLYTVYTHLQNLANEIANIVIGAYTFYPISIGSNSITIQVYMDNG